ncbi:hypothetical protein [Halomonas sp. WWR20]
MQYLEPRILKLESDMSDIKVSLAKIEGRLEKIDDKLNNCLTKGQLAVYALLCVLGILGAGWWIVQQYLSPILTSLNTQ